MKNLRNWFSRPAIEEGILLALVVAAILSGRFFGWESNGWQNVILILAVTVATLSLRSARRTERQKATLAFLREYHNSDIVEKGAQILNRPENQDGASLNEEEKIAVRDFLNQLELLAIGLNSGIYDEKMVRDAMETAIIRYYKRGENFIKQCRIKDGDVREVAYEHFEKLSGRLQDGVKSK